jgi:hypothetical protein
VTSEVFGFMDFTCIAGWGSFEKRLRRKATE